MRLDGLSVMALGTFKGNIWEGQTKASMAMFIDERADERQREALQMIFGGRVGGWPGTFANFIGEVRGMEFAHIDFHVDDDLASWRAEIPGKVKSSAEALGGPTTPPGKRVQVHNAGGCETGPGGVATYGKVDRRQGRRLRLQVGSHRAVEQAHRIRLVRTRRLMIGNHLSTL